MGVEEDVPYGQRLVEAMTPFKLAYIDAFAGAGTREGGHQQDETWFDASLSTEDAQYRHGSPLIALQNMPAFDQFYFIEQNMESIESLKRQVAASEAAQAGRVNFLHGDANQHLQALASMNWVSTRAVAFLDPFALHVTWTTLQKIAQTKAIDMWRLFPAMAVNRMLPQHGEMKKCRKWKGRRSRALALANYGRLMDWWAGRPHSLRGRHAAGAG
jgi:three-Cys-motif partner protein